jgi:hypothetical protein
MGRDLLIGSWQRDLRLRQYRRHFKDPPGWVLEMIEQVPREFRHQAMQLLLLQFEHRRHLAQLMENTDGAILRRLRRMWNCPPYGMLHEKVETTGRTRFQTCDLQRQCPWCLVRNAILLYRRIEAGPWHVPGDRVLVLASVRLDDELLSEAGFSTDDRIRSVRRQLAPQLIKFAANLGVDGGILTYLVGPRRFSENEWDHGEVVGPSYWRGFDYYLSVLGEVGQRLGLLRQHVAQSATDTDLPGIAVGSNAFWPEVRVRSGHRALRQLLIGTSLRHPSNKELVDGRGALFLPSWPLADLDQWSTHAQQARSLPIFTFFGTWRQIARQQTT